MTHKYTESTLEDAVLSRLESLGFAVAFGPDIAFDRALGLPKEKFLVH